MSFRLEQIRRVIMRAAKAVVLLSILFVVILVTASPIPRLETSAVPVYLASGKLLTNSHEVVGRVTGASPINVQLAGGARFSNAATYFCVASGADETQTLGPQVVNLDGSRFRILHGSADPASVVYRCIGI